MVDSEGHAFAGYLVSPDRPAIIIVRPDSAWEYLGTLFDARKVD